MPSSVWEGICLQKTERHSCLIIVASAKATFVVYIPRWNNYRHNVGWRFEVNFQSKLKCSTLGRLNSWVVSHLALIIGTLRHALGREVESWWWLTFFGLKHNIYALFMILFGLFDLILLFVMWIVKQKIENKINLFL